MFWYGLKHNLSVITDTFRISNRTAAPEYHVLSVLPYPVLMLTILFQILDQGFILHPGAYMRDFWNVMDITVVTCALISFYHTIA